VSSFTYQVPPGGADPEGVEGYRVYAGDEAVGKVGVVLDRNGERLLVVEGDGLISSSEPGACRGRRCRTSTRRRSPSG